MRPCVQLQLCPNNSVMHASVHVLWIWLWKASQFGWKQQDCLPLSLEVQLLPLRSALLGAWAGIFFLLVSSWCWYDLWTESALVLLIFLGLDLSFSFFASLLVFFASIDQVISVSLVFAQLRKFRIREIERFLAQLWLV